MVFWVKKPSTKFILINRNFFVFPVEVRRGEVIRIVLWVLYDRVTGTAGLLLIANTAAVYSLI